MPTKHARCSASAAYRWINCPGSVALSDQCPDPGSSSYADEGTVAHSLAELKLRHVLHEITDAQYKKRLAKIQQDDYYNGEMDEATDFYVETVLEEFAAAGEGAELMIEQRLDLSQWIPEGFGTSDAVIIGGSMIRESRSTEEEEMETSFGAKAMFPLAVATSIDALTVGITFAFLSVPIGPAVALIGVITCVLSAIGVKAGGVVGEKGKSWAELAGGIVLILMGTKILLEHLGVLG